MSTLFFTIELETYKKTPYLVLVTQEKEGGMKRNFYKSYLTSVASPKQKEAVALLIKEELEFLNISPFSPQVETCVFNKIRVKEERAPHLLKILALSGSLEWKGKKLFFDPFTQVEVVLEATFEQDGLNVERQYKIGNKEREIEFLFSGDPAWVVADGTIYFIHPEVERRWLTFSQGILTGTKKEDFLEEFKNTPPLYPQVVWKGKESSQNLKPIEPVPFLVLKDRHGAFADLWMDYGALGQIALHEVKVSSFRLREKELDWEKDLLETHFTKKIVDTSHYYCPLDKVAKSISFLIELGWKVLDHKNRIVVRQSDESFECTLEKDVLVLKGKIAFDAHQVDLTEVVGAFNRRERFVELSTNHVALIDYEKEDKIKDLCSQEIEGNTIRVKKMHFGMMDAFFASPKITKDASVIDLTQGVVNAPPSERFLGSLYPYQQEGVNWLTFLHNGGLSGLLADEMGLGKTVQVLAFLSQLKKEEDAPILIVMPTSLLFNWRKEVEKFLPTSSYYVHSGQERVKETQLIKGKEMILTSYSYLRLDSAFLQSIEYSMVILDEAQYIKNPESQVAKAAFALKGKQRLVITGTPIENSFDDLWSLFHFLMPELLEERRDFNAKMAALALDNRHLLQAKKKVSPFILRRKKEDVARDLPPKYEQVVFTEMSESQRDLYESFLAKTRTGVMKKVEEGGMASNRLEILEAILRLRQICCHPHLVEGECPGESGKIERLMEDLEEIASLGRKVLVFSQFTQMLQLIRKEVEKRSWRYVYLDGSTKDREAVVEKFQEEEDVCIFLMSLKAGGVGLNLTAADYVILFDPWWNDAVENQAIDRAHRLGRNSSIIAKRYITPLSIEEKMMRLKENKTRFSSGILDSDQGLEQLTLKDLYELLN